MRAKINSCGISPYLYNLVNKQECAFSVKAITSPKIESVREQTRICNEPEINHYVCKQYGSTRGDVIAQTANQHSFKLYK